MAAKVGLARELKRFPQNEIHKGVLQVSAHRKGLDGGPYGELEPVEL